MYISINSEDKQYRYLWAAKVSDNTKRCMFLMLNPSIADENRSDPTVTRCMNFARDWGYGSLYVTNLFALRSTDPKMLKFHDDPIGKLNDDTIVEAARDSDIVVCAWGNHGKYLDRSESVVHAMKKEGFSGKLHCLGLTKLNQPKHPLYLSKSTVLQSL